MLDIVIDLICMVGDVIRGIWEVASWFVDLLPDGDSHRNYSPKEPAR